MSELDEFGIVRYIIDTGDKVVSILLNDIAEDTGDNDDTLMVIREKNIPLYDDIWDSNPKQSSEYILAKGTKFYVETWHSLGFGVYFVVDLYTTERGIILYLDSNRPDRLYDVDWLIQNKCLVGHDGGFLKRNYRMFSRCHINFYGAKKVIHIDHSKIEDFYGFEKFIANSFINSSQKKQGS